MKTIRKLLAALTLLASMTATAPAQAVVVADCGGNWVSSGTCNFVFTGGGFLALGDATSPVVGARVDISIIEPTTGRVLHRCFSESRDGRSTQCVADRSTPLPVDPQAELNVGAVLRCRVTGTAAGTYLCRSVVL